MKRFIWLILIMAFISLPLVVKGQESSDLLAQYLFPIQYGQTVLQNDVIGLRIYKNLDNLDPQKWYENNVLNPQSGLDSLQVDGYRAVRDDRTVYIQAANILFPQKKC